jgi:type IV secretion system protein VirB10
MAKGPNDREIPSSPDELQGGLRGRIGGVTRVGPRAFGVAFFVVCALLVAILYGVNKQSAKPTTEALASPPAAIQSSEAHFGSNEPLVPSAPPETPPPPLLLAPTSVPNLDNADKTPQPPSTTAPRPVQPLVDQRLVEQQSAEEKAREDAEKKREELLEAARKSPILTGNGQGGGVSGGAGQSVQLAFAGNGEPAAGNDGDAGSASYASLPATNQSAGGVSGTSGGNNLVSRTVAQSAARPQESPNAFLEGPTGQYRVNAAQVALPEGASSKDFLEAQRFSPLSPYEILASSVIPATLITGIDSDEPGLLSAQVREDVYDTKTGRYLLIPRGSRLVGLYKSDLSYGQSRVLVAWNRLIFPDTTSIDLLNMSGSDVGGFAGFGGDVDNHYGKIFGAALLTSILAAGLELSQPQSTTSSILQVPSAGQVVGQAVGQQLSQTATTIISKDLNIPPTLYVAKGYPFIVFVDRDIVLPGPYRAQ